ncbi:alpha-amylase family protein [Roseivirga sp. UBA1976]|uniref:alpha-amylase family protein n=1 Tax=Roseivirga sp. UBA1976 TaxID=1947386 RepID=UPI00257DE695|nr:alpha-amylase family protein [Roseivirga sp. UBA1976]|tara:strand:+ start:10203 stop:12146 length:1944 start_codon:yes stop_codon:yes gene_type:complete
MYNPTAHITLKALETKVFGKENGLRTPFEQRLIALFSDIYSRFEQLYGQHPSFEPALELLLQKMLAAYKARPKHLLESDAHREANPGWFCNQETTAMMLYVDRFNNDLKGLLEKMDYFEELGVNMLHLMPLFDSPKVKNDGGYAVSNYRQVNARFGTNGDLVEVAKKLKQSNKLLMLDFVVNHTSDEHEWAVKAKAGDRFYQNFYHTFRDRTISLLYEQAMPEVFPESAPGNFTFNKEMNCWVMTVFNEYQWDLNYSNPYVFVEMLDNVLFQANMGVDIFRMDAVAFVWKQMGTSCQNLPQAHIVHQLFKLCSQVVAPGVAFLAEAIVSPEEIVKYFGTSNVWSNEHDMAYNATLMALLWNSLATRNTRVMKASLRDKPKKPKGTTWVNYVRCHDDIGMGFEDRHIAESEYDPAAHRKFLTRFFTGDFEGSFAKGLPFMYNPKTDDARISGSMASLAGLEQALQEGNELGVKRAIARINLLHGIILSYGGIPVIYSGDEIAMLNDYSFLEDESKKDDNRWVHRPKMDWALAEKRKKPDTPQAQVFRTLQHMIALRKSIDEFGDHNNFRLIETSNEHVFAFERSWKGKSTVVIANFKDDGQYVYSHLVFPQTMVNPFGMKDRLSGNQLLIEEGRLHFEPYQLYWLTNG